MGWEHADGDRPGSAQTRTHSHAHAREDGSDSPSVSTQTPIHTTKLTASQNWSLTKQLPDENYCRKEEDGKGPGSARCADLHEALGARGLHPTPAHAGRCGLGRSISSAQTNRGTQDGSSMLTQL